MFRARFKHFRSRNLLPTISGKLILSPRGTEFEEDGRGVLERAGELEGLLLATGERVGEGDEDATVDGDTDADVDGDTDTVCVEVTEMVIEMVTLAVGEDEGTVEDVTDAVGVDDAGTGETEELGLWGAGFGEEPGEEPVVVGTAVGEPGVTVTVAVTIAVVEVVGEGSTWRAMKGMNASSDSASDSAFTILVDSSPSCTGFQESTTHGAAADSPMWLRILSTFERMERMKLSSAVASVKHNATRMMLANLNMLEMN